MCVTTTSAILFSISDPACTSGPPNDIIIATVIAVLVLIMALAAVIVLIVVIHLRKYKQNGEIQEFQNVETKEEDKEAESYVDDWYDDIINKNGVKTGANSAPVMDALYSNPDEATTDESYSHLQDSQKEKITPQNMATIGYKYPQLNCSQNEPVVQKSGPSPPQQKFADVGMLYSVPNKKKKGSNSVP